MSLLKVNNLKSGYAGLPILRGVNVKVEEGQIVCVVGSNGAGKTTLLKTICGFLVPMEGEIEFSGRKIDGLPTHRIINLGIGIVPEGRQLFPNLTVRENLEVGSYIKSARIQREKSLEEVFSLFPRLKERSNQLAGTLSGGEQQMLAIARGLMLRPKLLLMDEPSWGLAPFLVTELYQTIQTIREKGTSVLLVEQNVYKALQVSDWGYVLERGELVLEGKGGDLLNNPDLKKAYLGM
jgi:branched-chain amino acid transport system ATP-binding protein